MSQGGEDNFIRIAGQIAVWPDKERMVEILQAAGLHVRVGQYSIRVNDCSSFVFQEYGGDLGDPVIDASAESVQAMRRDAKLVSDVLTLAGIRHRFELYDATERLVDYLHYDWPQPR